MALTASLRRTLLMLLMITVFILMILYWNQASMKPFSLINGYDKTSRLSLNNNQFYMPVEKIWTYKCEGDKCIRYHYLEMTKGEKRVPFMTCSMTCGDINIWPHPTIKTAVSSRSLTFTMQAIRLQMKTPNNNINVHLNATFELFLKNMRIIQRLKFPENLNDTNKHNEYLKTVDRQLKKQKIKTNNNLITNIYSETSNSAKHTAKSNDRFSAAYSLISTKMFSTSSKNCDIHTFTIQVNVRKYDEMHLNSNTDESYHLKTSYRKPHYIVEIDANSFFGARHALSTLQQLIWYDDEFDLLRIISKAIIMDAPKFPYRGLMLDTSRHYFSTDAIKRTIEGMSYAKLNRFHWHITDSQSFPYVSKHYPELALYGAYSNSETYTDNDIRDIVAFAQLHGVQVIPEIDAPAHAGNGWDWGPKRGLGDLSLCVNQQPWNFYCGEPPCGQLNPKNNNTYLILQKLYEELLELSGPSDYFHLGGDEVNLECWAQYFNDTDLRGLWCDFMHNTLNSLKSANKNVQPKFVVVWSSGLTNTKCLSKRHFTVQIWGGSSWQENYDLIDNGFNVIFSHVDAWYLDCGFGNWRATGEGACSPYRTWQNIYKHRPWERMHLDKIRKRQVLGGEVCLWTEQVDEGQLDNRLWPRSAALGERLWSDPDDEHDMDTVPQDVFKRMSVFRNRLVELGLKAEPIFPKYCAQNPGECI